jgi:Skp family chaperone for outer membrane proteins
MRVFAVALTLSVVLLAGTASTASAQAAAGTQNPATPAPQVAAPAPAPAPALVPFQDGLKYAYVNLQAVAANSNEGKAAAARIKEFQDQKVSELNNRNKALQAAQQKLEQGGSVMSDAARAQLQTEIERQQRDIQRFSEDAQQDAQNFSQQVQEDFNRKLNPIVDKVAREKKVHFVFSAGDSGLIWADPSMDLTAAVVETFNLGTPAPPAAAKPAAPAAAPPATSKPAAPTTKP